MLEALPARAQTWLTYDRSITEAASALTGVQARVSSLSQQAQYAPRWLAARYRSDEQTYARQIELMSGACRVLIAVSYTRPDSDLAERLEVLDRAPLANLLFQTGSVQNPAKTYVQTGAWHQLTPSIFYPRQYRRRITMIAHVNEVAAAVTVIRFRIRYQRKSQPCRLWWMMSSTTRNPSSTQP